jgi:hypothetical protein
MWLLGLITGWNLRYIFREWKDKRRAERMWQEVKEEIREYEKQERRTRFEREAQSLFERRKN